ncbi:hypothetical protein LZ32DRAFT_55139 [Colletotrichum eremochloae]|nr:hypothetical protein LZ32DRAFT_55139 [Colletotrichum eremochloae]
MTMRQSMTQKTRQRLEVLGWRLSLFFPRIPVGAEAGNVATGVCSRTEWPRVSREIGKCVTSSPRPQAPSGLFRLTVAGEPVWRCRPGLPCPPDAITSRPSSSAAQTWHCHAMRRLILVVKNCVDTLVFRCRMRVLLPFASVDASGIPVGPIKLPEINQSTMASHSSCCITSMWL